MRNRVLHIIIGVLLCLGVNAQIVAPMGYGLPASPKKITAYNKGLVVVYENLEHKAELQVWNGDFWYKIDMPSLPSLGTSNYGEFNIVDLIQYKNDVFLCAAYAERKDEAASNFILKWDGSTWTNVTSSLVAKSLVIDKLVVQNNELICIGKFLQNDTKFNTIGYVASTNTWEQRGNLITRNVTLDSFTSLAQANNKVYATGSFTSPNSGTFSLAIFDGNNWELAPFPPFIGQNIILGEYNNNVVVYGKSNFTNESIKISSGNLWQDISGGLQDYIVKDIHSFAQLEGSLFAVGAFEEKSSSNTLNILEYTGEQWVKTNLNLSSIEQLYTDNSSVIVSGDFSDNARINFIGKIYKDQAQIAARVYFDKNSNCVKDVNEEWFSNYPISIAGMSENLSTDKYGQLYLPVSQDNYTLNAASVNYWKPTCPDAKINAFENRTYYGAILGVNQEVGIQDIAVYVSDNQSYTYSDGESKRALVCYQNIGSQPLNDAVLTLTHSSSISNFSSEFPVESYSNNKATWKVDIDQNDEKCFYVSYTTSAADNVSLIANIALRSGLKDENGSNNIYQVKYKQGSTLVNEKYCDNGLNISKNEELLRYKIGIKNVGNSPALDIKVVDELDTDIYISYKGIISNTGHNCDLLDEYTLMPNGNYRTKLVWSFNNINLPSSVSNDANSESFVDLNVNILPNMIAEGQSICNQAKIYFSYKAGSFDEPIFTKEVCSTVGQTSAIIGQNKIPSYVDGLSIGPNPVEDLLFFKNDTYQNFDIVLTNVLGQTIDETTIKKNAETSVRVSSFDKGIYFVYANGIFVHKFVVK